MISWCLVAVVMSCPFSASACSCERFPSLAKVALLTSWSSATHSGIAQTRVRPSEASERSVTSQCQHVTAQSCPCIGSVWKPVTGVSTAHPPSDTRIATGVPQSSRSSRPSSGCSARSPPWWSFPRRLRSISMIFW